ncbi:unnamed protein product [Boreogadus saida]
MSSSKSPIKLSALGATPGGLKTTCCVLKTVSQSIVEIPATLKKRSWFVCPVPSPLPFNYPEVSAIGCQCDWLSILSTNHTRLNEMD